MEAEARHVNDDLCEDRLILLDVLRGDVVEAGQILLAGRTLAVEHVVLGQPHPPLIPGDDLDTGEVALSHLVSHLDVLAGHHDDGVSGEVFVDVGVAAVVEQTDGRVEAVTDSSDFVLKLWVGRLSITVDSFTTSPGQKQALPVQSVRALRDAVRVELHQLKQVDQHSANQSLVLAEIFSQLR